MAVSAPSNTRPRQAGRLGTEEFHSAPLPAAQEAAVLFAANHADAAIALLKAEIKDPLGRNNKQAWLLLFDLYQSAQSRQEFDALSMLFSVKFEQSPPAWVDAADNNADPRRQQRDRKDLFVIKPAADGSILTEIDKLPGFADVHGSVRIDFGRIVSITEPESGKLASVLAGLRRKNVPMWFNHPANLEQKLRAAFNDGVAGEHRAYWLLLFELYVLLGNSQAFEDLGLEYAVAFEMSPPNWEVYVNPVSAAVETQAAPAAASPSAPEAGFALKGVLTANNANQIAEMNAYAASATEVVVDLGKVMRLDFNYTGAFFDAIKAIQLAGKRVILTGLTELNAALLEALGVNRYAILVRRKST